MDSGICIRFPAASDSAVGRALLCTEWERLGIESEVVCREQGLPGAVCLRLHLAAQGVLERMPGHDTLGLAESLKLDVRRNEDDLLREIWLTLLNSPVLLEFPSAEELLAAVSMRRRIVKNASRTRLNFDLEAIERPKDCWRYSKETGFVLIPGSPLISSLKKACQPEEGGQWYSFSCYRATEYVVLLSVAEEAQMSHPELLNELQCQWERKALTADPFQDVFLHEQGNLEEPFPMHYYVPGDRVWFRNPDSHSSDVPGFEGSWVFYLGGGMFANFWKSDRPFSLLTKCLEVYHWRDGVFKNERGVLQMDEARVEELVSQTLAEPAVCARIYERMHRLRDARGIYAEGGCMDASREWPRFILPPHSDMIRILRASQPHEDLPPVHP
ncbi:hypothetical protein [Prosthecobacter fluviatilis]|uniref:Uncharacterized protein n=1 Tax=Prosthecobacter fluviatilis TaxID=445931 RepID=A0ABW0KKA9_9BACT